jgi:hypothetical protein
MAKVRSIRKDIPDTWEEAMQQYLWFKKAEGLRGQHYHVNYYSLFPPVFMSNFLGPL